VIGSIFVWPYLPYGIFRASQPDYVTLIYLEVYNMETNEVAFSEVQEYHVRDSQDVVNSTLYDMFLKLNPKKKKK
jgi:hypothetical protein